jgi:predicted permease
MGSGSSDLIYGLRQIRRNLWMAAACVAVLALGIGAAAAVFTVLYDAVLRPLPYPNPDQLVAVYNEFPQSPQARKGVSSPDFMDLGTHRELFTATAAYFFNDFTMTGTAYAQHVDAVNVSASVFPLLGVPVALGRAFTADEERAGAHVAILSDSLWRSTFGADATVIGKRIALDNSLHEIIGVMPPAFQFPYPATQMWVPLRLSPARLVPRERGRKWLQMIARLAPSVTPERATAALGQIGQGLASAFPDVYPVRAGWHFSSVSVAAQQTATIRRWLVLAFGAVLCVLVIACINASGLLLVHTTARQREWAVRASLGATPARLFRQMLAETAPLALAAGILAVLFAVGLVRLINQVGPVRPSAIGLWTYVFASAITVGVTVLAGAVPALAILHLPLDQSLKAGDRRTSTGRSRWRNVLVAGQIGVAIALLFTATALTRSFAKLLETPLGFASERVWTAAIQLPDRDAATASSFFQLLTKRISALPGVESASAGNVPFNPSGMRVVDLHFPGRPEASVRPAATLNVVLPSYFETLRIPLLKGRTFSESDGAGASAVAIVDGAFVQKYFPAEDPIGKLVSRDVAKDRAYAIVGVVGSVASREVGEAPQPEFYLSALQYGQSATYLVVREAPAQDVTSSVRETLREMDASIPLFDVDTLAGRIFHTVRVSRFVAWLLGAFAAVGLMLAALALYGTLAHVVELRRREIAIRLAVGASRGSVRSLFARQGFFIASAGLVPGAVLAFAASMVTRSFLFGIGPFDPWTVAETLLGFAVVSTLASWIPAAIAARGDAVSALRDE